MEHYIKIILFFLTFLQLCYAVPQGNYYYIEIIALSMEIGLKCANLTAATLFYLRFFHIT